MDVVSQREPKNVYHFMALSELQETTPTIEWSKFMKAAQVPPVTQLNVANPDFYKGLNALLDATDLQTIKTYLRWQLLRSSESIVLPKAFDEENFDF